MFHKSLSSIVAFAVVALTSSYSMAESYALIMAVGDYQWPGISKLNGTRSDATSAAEMARKMGVPERNISLFFDAQVTKSDVLGYLDKLANKMGDGDQAFVYFSGHGSRSLIVETDKKGFPRRCAEAIVTVEGNNVYDYDIEDSLKKISDKAHRVFVMIDACHSGGVTKRAGTLGELTAKFTQPNASECSKPVNVLTRGANQAAKTLGNGGNNMVVIAAARDNEVAFDLPTGGLATTSIKQCMFSQQADRDGSGAASWEELVQCAQSSINNQIKHVDRLPQNITLHGNPRAIAKFDPPVLPSTTSGGNAQTSPQQVMPPSALNMQVAAQPITQQPQSITPLLPLGNDLSTFKTLEDLYQQRDDRRLVKLNSRTGIFRIGKDNLEFEIQSDREGYLYILAAGSDGKTIDILFPNKLDQANKILADETLTLPRSPWMLTASGPPGKNRLLVLVTDSKRDFSSLPLITSGPFSIVRQGIESQGKLQNSLTISPLHGLPTCSSIDRQRNFVVSKECSNRFGAALIDLEEAL